MQDISSIFVAQRRKRISLHIYSPVTVIFIIKLSPSTHKDQTKKIYILKRERELLYLLYKRMIIYYLTSYLVISAGQESRNFFYDNSKNLIRRIGRESLARETIGRQTRNMRSRSSLEMTFASGVVDEDVIKTTIIDLKAR